VGLQLQPEQKKEAQNKLKNVSERRKKVVTRSRNVQGRLKIHKIIKIEEKKLMTCRTGLKNLTTLFC